MKIVWDEPKRQANFDKHGFDFAEVDDFVWETATNFPEQRGIKHLRQPRRSLPEAAVA